ncbi:MAG TPA: AraC family transcriptional regulator [Desulfotomaculum sp.]|nr:MAG: Transcription activator, effector binding protein [Desulfotomaculum sp. 46_80]HAG11389.1 AraC family transcriptional regulator [Desulfotomaculum sp.]HBY05185.1 AraC family transcriptional regulator [Desulfotomaculum sp.]
MSWNIELKEQNLQPILFIKAKTSLEGLQKIIGESYTKIIAYLTELGEQPAFAPFTAYYNLDMQNLEVELGFPVAKQLPGKEEILSGQIPPGRVISCVYKGSYAGMEKLYTEMFEWIAEHGYEFLGVFYEYYLNSPMEVPESELLTRIDLPIKTIPCSGGSE